MWFTHKEHRIFHTPLRIPHELPTHCVTPLCCLRFLRKNNTMNMRHAAWPSFSLPNFWLSFHHLASVLCFPASFTFDSPAPCFPSLHNHLLISPASYDPSFILLPYFPIHFTLWFCFFSSFQSLQLPFGFPRFRYLPSFHNSIIIPLTSCPFSNFCFQVFVPFPRTVSPFLLIIILFFTSL